MFKLLIGAGKWAGAFALVGALAWQAASHPIRLDAEVVVHVTVPDVEVWVDDLRFQVVRPWEHPIVCQLPEGVHELAMRKAGVELFHETFVVEEGEDNVLTAWDENGVLGCEPDAAAERTAFQSGAERSIGFAPDPLRRN
jgi:hypothetical protein